MQEEQERKHVPSSVESYVKEYDVTEEYAYEMLNKQIEDVWKHINLESLMTKNVPMPIIMVVINLVRVLEVLYKDNDSFTNVSQELINHIKSLLVHSQSI